MFLNDWLSRRNLYTPEAVGVVDDSDGRRYRYAELDRRATRLAHYLQRKLAIQPGDRVACLSGNRIEYIDLYFACGKIGAVLVPLNYRLPPKAILELLSDCQPSVLLHEAEFAEIAVSALQTSTVPACLPIDGEKEACAAQLVSDGNPPLPEINAYHAEQDDTAMILYTSGTTGRAKGAMIPYRQIHWNALNTIIGLQLTAADAAFLNMPLYHTGGWHVLFTPLMLLGGRVILQRNFDPQRCNELLGPEQITILFGVPTTLRMMCEADNFADADFSHTRFAIFGGESCPLPVIEAYAERGVAMRQGYGLTEAGPNCFSLPAADAIEKRGSIGFPNYHVATRLNRDDGSEAGPGEVGELCMRGPHVFSGYWQDAAETDAVFTEGWLATGDLMKRDDEGYHYVVGRKKDMFISGGENVYPAEVERILQLHEAVATAAVVGVPDAKWGECGVAFVQLAEGRNAGVAQLYSWCRERLAGFQCPQEIFFVEQLPLGDSGKIDKRTLQAQARDRAAHE